MKGTFFLSAIFLLVSMNGVQAQSYSNPEAPVGDTKRTVPACVKPILDHWLRDTYVMYGPDGYYYMTGTTAVPDRKYEVQVHCWDWNDGIYLWRSKDMKTWEAQGRIWSFEKDEWQSKGKPVKPGAKSVNGDPLDSIYRAVWAPELHYIKSKKQWLLVACLNGGAGSFILKSTSGKPEGPYVNIEGNKDKAIFPRIDLALFEDDNGDVYAVGHNHEIAKLKDDLSGLAEPFRALKETPYNPEPYIEGVTIVKHHGKYQLLQTVWSIKQPDGSYLYIRGKDKGKEVHSYDVVVSEADNVYGPYGPRYPAILQGGHNNLFTDNQGEWWSTTFFNPRGTMGTLFPITCRPAVVAVKWEEGKLMPDLERNEDFYKSLHTQPTSKPAGKKAKKGKK